VTAGSIESHQQNGAHSTAIVYPHAGPFSTGGDVPEFGTSSGSGGARKAEQATIRNFTLVEKKTDHGMEFIPAPKSLPDLVSEIHAATDNWPRCAGAVAFVDEAVGGIRWFARDRVANLFAWLRSHFKVEWKNGDGYVTRAELLVQLAFDAPKYAAVELLPHEPRIDSVYYRCGSPPPGDGRYLNNLLDRFRPATEIDRLLLQAALMTLFWGGPPGMRPVFTITSDDGRGVGKSKTADVLCHVAGGYLDVDAGCDIDSLKHRLLSPEGLSKRAAMLDNVKSLRFSWAELEKLVTANAISGKQMYVGEGQRPNYMTWFITLNGVALGEDMAQRSVIVKVRRGANSGTWYEDTIRFVDQHRTQIIGDLIAALRADRNPLRGHSRWAAWEHDVLARLPDPDAVQRLIRERQNEANCELDEAELIEERFAKKLRSYGYDPATAVVHIPAKIAGDWLGDAIGEKTRTAAASKRLNQLASEKKNQGDEGKLQRIRPNPSRTHGRGFLWVGEYASPDDPVDYELETRVETTTPRWSAVA